MNVGVYKGRDLLKPQTRTSSPKPYMQARSRISKLLILIVNSIYANAIADFLDIGAYVSTSEKSLMSLSIMVKNLWVVKLLESSIRKINESILHIVPSFLPFQKILFSSSKSRCSCFLILDVFLF